MAAPEPAGPALGVLQQRRADAARPSSLRHEKQTKVCRTIQCACRDHPGEPDDSAILERDEDQVAFSQTFAEARVCTMASYTVPTQQR